MRDSARLLAFSITGLAKGQIISECLFDVFKFSKKPTKNLTNFCPGSKKWSNYKIKAPNSKEWTGKTIYFNFSSIFGDFF